MRTLCRFLAAAVCAGLSVGTLLAQSSSGTITGRVLDPSGQVVPGATVTLVRTDTRQARTLVTPASGDITFASLQPGPYTLQVGAPGFKTLEKADLSLSASERLSVGNLVLEIGGPDGDRRRPRRGHAGPDGELGARRPGRLQPGGPAADARPRHLRPDAHPARRRLRRPWKRRDRPATSPEAISGTRGIYSGASIDGVSGNVRSGNQPGYHDRHGRRGRGEGAPQQLSGRVRKGRGRHRQHRHQGRHQRVPRLGLLLWPPREAERQQLLRERGGQRARAVSIQHRGRHTRRSAPRRPLQKGKDKLFFFLQYEYRPSTEPQGTRGTTRCRRRPSATATSVGRWATRGAISIRPPGSSIR